MARKRIHRTFTWEDSVYNSLNDLSKKYKFNKSRVTQKAIEYPMMMGEKEFVKWLKKNKLI